MQVGAFQARWELVNAAERVKLQATPLERKLSQLAVLMNLVESLGWIETLKAEEAEVRERRNRLRAISNG